jgi:hypothetical protein
VNSVFDEVKASSCQAMTHYQEVSAEGP